jgi:hypothetical protein
VVATNLVIPSAATVGKDGAVYAVIGSLVPGSATVAALD